MSVIDNPRTTSPRRPRGTVSRVDLEFGPSRPGQFDGVRLPRTMSRRHLTELVRLEPALLEHLARRPADRRTLLTDPASVLRAAAPEASPALVEAVRATHASGKKLPAEITLDLLDIGVKDLAPLRPRPVRPIRPVPKADAASLGGFDGGLAVGAGALGRALALLLPPRLNTALDGLGLVAGPLSAVLSVVGVTVSPALVIDAAAGRARVDVTVEAELDVDLVSLVPVPLDIAIDVAVARDGDAVEIDASEVTVDVQGLPDVLDGLLAVIVGTVADAVQGAFPVSTPVSVPGGGAGPCDIALRDFAVAFLPGQAGRTDPCLGLFTSLLPGSAGDIAALTSPLPAGADGGLFLDNFFLLSQIRCAIQEELNLPAPDEEALRTDPDPTFVWTGLAIEQEIETEDGTETIEIHAISVGIDGADPAAKAFVVAAELTIKRSLFNAHVDLQRIPLTLTLEDGAINAAVGEPVYELDVDATVLGVIIGVVLVIAVAVVAGIVGSVVTALVAGGIAIGALAVIVAAIVAVIRAKVGDAITGAAGQQVASEQVIPPPLVALFGVLDVQDLVFDDLELTGTLTAVAPSLEVNRRTLSQEQHQVADGDPDAVTFHVARTVELRAVAHGLQAPVGHQWTFDGLPLVHGQPPAGSGMSALSVVGGTVRVTNGFGSDVDGTVGVHATDAFGTTLSASVGIDIVGSVVLPVEDVPGPKPNPNMPEQ